MISRPDAKKVVAAFAGLPFYPSAPEAKRELIDAVCDSCVSASHGSQVKEAIIYDCDRSPTPKQIRDIARQSAPKTNTPTCSKCDGTGFIQVKKGHYSAVDYCSCRQRPDTHGPAAETEQDGNQEENAQWATDMAKQNSLDLGDEAQS